jgi:ribonuclease HI
MASGYAIYVDGSPGPATGGRPGWGAVLMIGPELVYASCGGYDGQRMTNNAIELEALAHGLSLVHLLDNPGSVTVWTDSGYAASVAANLHRFHACGWVNAKGRPLVNAGRMLKLHTFLYDLELGRRCVVRWTKGHSRNTGNDLADSLARKAAYEKLTMEEKFQ